MTALTLYYHPLSSYCQKALIAIDALGIEVERRLLDFGDPAQRADFVALWPAAKIPLLVDGGRPVPETSILIEHLQRHHARNGRRLIPDDPDTALDVRLWDRLFDAYVMTPMQALTGDLLRPESARDPAGVAQARQRLAGTYVWLDRHLAGRTWASGDAFSLADCAAAPALFYAVTHVPFGADQPHLAAYFERLVGHPPVAAAIDHARPWFAYYPARAGLAARFLDASPSPE